MNLDGPPVAKALSQDASDGEGRKLGEQKGLDTPVVLAVNYAHCFLLRLRALAGGKRKR